MKRLAALILLATPGLAWANDEDSINKVVIGDNTPLFQECYENAEDGLGSYDALEPCNRSLEEEFLTTRKTAILHANRGVIYFHIGEYESAVDDFTTALDLGIHVEARIYANRGLSYEAMNYDALARADYEAALAINPNNQMAQRRLAELDKPLYERSRLPRRIKADTPPKPSIGI